MTNTPGWHHLRKRVHLICFLAFLALPFFNVVRFDIPRQRFYFAGFLAPVVTGYILEWGHENWDLTFYVSAAIYLMGIVCWAFLDSNERLETA